MPQDSALQTGANPGKIEIAGVYNHGGDRTKGWGVHAIKQAVREGGNYLEAFEGNERFSLPLYYHAHLGVEPIGYSPWDHQHAPRNWNAERDNEPGVVQMQIPPKAFADLDTWLSKRHDSDQAVFLAKLKRLKQQAGVQMDENKKSGHDAKKHRDHCVTPEEYARLVDGVDEFYFGSGDDTPMPDSEDKIGRFLHMKAHEWNVSLDEAANRSMARLYNHINNDEKGVIILTAFRHENDLKTNRQLNVSLSSDIRSLGWGYTPVIGGFVEKGEGGKDVHVQEESLFVTVGLSDPKQIMSKVLDLLKKYQQQAALVKLPGESVAFLLWDNGTTTPAGQWHADPKQMAQYYTQMRNGPAGRQFKFEAAGDDSVMTRLAVEHYFKSI